MTDPQAGPPIPDATTASILDLAATRPALLDGARLICVDGRAGSGKTTLALRLADRARACGLATRLLHTDEHLAGWQGLRTLGPRLREHLISPLAAGRPARIGRWDWYASHFTGAVEIRPAGEGDLDLLILEGVGSAYPGLLDRCTAAVWVEAPTEQRRARALARDGETFAPYWDRWAADELAYAAHRDDCDLVVDGRDWSVRTRP